VGQSSIEESSSWATFVFVGKVKAINTIKEGELPSKYFELEIVEAIKGAPTEGYFIKPSPIKMLTNCYPQKIDVGDLYVFFTRDNKETSLSHCSSTQHFNYLESSQPDWRDSVK
jgi:hypothetical protein